MTAAEPLALAVDGGGGKTDLALVDFSGKLLAHVRGGRTQVHYLSPAGTVSVLQTLLDQALELAGLRAHDQPVAAAARLLIAGLDLPEELAAFDLEIQATGWAREFVIGNDTDAVLRAGSDRGWGIAVVCGTGINCAGIAADGREARFLSFGDVSGDWGGGPDIGMAALAAAVRANDGRGPKTELERLIPKYFELPDALAVARAFHLEELPMTRLAELAPVVIEACDRDLVAEGIMQRIVDEVVAFVCAAINRLALERADPDVVLGGRVMRSLPSAMQERLTLAVQACAPRALVRVSPSEPIAGAVLLALDALGASQAAKSRARAEIDAASPTPNAASATDVR